MKRTLALLAALAVVLVLVPLALAGNGHGNSHGWAHGKSKFQLNGRLVSVDPGTGTLVVLVRTGSKTVKSFRGQELSLVVAPDARIVDGSAEEDATITLADIVPDCRVHVGGRIDLTDPANPVFVAGKIIVQRWPAVAPEPTPEPTPTDTGEPTPEPTPSASQ